VCRNLTYSKWNRGRTSPSNIEMRHPKRIWSEKVMIANDVYGHGEPLFVCKVVDPEIVNQPEQFVQPQQDIQRVTT
jgi:hypothetical protein